MLIEGDQRGAEERRGKEGRRRDDEATGIPWPLTSPSFSTSSFFKITQGHLIHTLHIYHFHVSMSGKQYSMGFQRRITPVFLYFLTMTISYSFSFQSPQSIWQRKSNTVASSDTYSTVVDIFCTVALILTNILKLIIEYTLQTKHLQSMFDCSSQLAGT